MTPRTKLIRITYLCYCPRYTMQRDSAPVCPLISVTTSRIPDSLMLNKIHSRNSPSSHRNKYSAPLTPCEPFTHRRVRSCIFRPNLFLIPLPSAPNKNSFKTCHPPSTAVLSIRLMSVAPTGRRYAVSLRGAWQLEFTGAKRACPETFGSQAVFVCAFYDERLARAECIYLKRCICISSFDRGYRLKRWSQ